MRLQVVAVKFIARWCQHTGTLAQEVSGQKRLPSLDKALQETVQHVRAKPHQSDVALVAVGTLAVLDRSFEHVRKFVFRAEKTRSHEVNHAPVFHEVVLRVYKNKRFRTLHAALENKKSKAVQTNETSYVQTKWLAESKITGCL